MSLGQAGQETPGRRWVGIGGVLVLALVAVLAASGAASTVATPTDGLLIGRPALTTVGIVLAAGLALLGLLRGQVGALAVGLGLLPVLAVLAAGAPYPGLAAWSGPPLLALVLGAAALALWTRGAPPEWTRRLFFPVVLILYVGIAAHVQRAIGPEGDGPHYLMVTESLLSDHDLDLTRDFEEQRYRGFYRGPALEPHRRVRGLHGETYSIHAIGLSLLLLPAYAAGGYPAASFFLALLGALLALEIRGLLRTWLGQSALGDGIAWAVALSPPLIHYTGVIFTEVPAALLIALILRHGKDVDRASTTKAALLGLALAALPWLNVRYGLPAAVLLLFLLTARPPRRIVLALTLPGVASALGIALFHHALYGFFDPRRVYGREPDFELDNLPHGLLGLLFDQEFGLLVYAPLFALALPGLFALLRRGVRLAAVAWTLVGVVFFTSAAWHMWRGGFNPPARFLVPLAPVLALAVAAALQSARDTTVAARPPRIGAALLIGWSLWTGLAGSLEPRLVHRDRDATAPLFRAYSGALEWTTLLPGYVPPPAGRAYDRSFGDRDVLTLIWGVGLLFAVLGPRRPRSTAARLVAASVGLLTLTVAAASLSTGKSEGRDAVRLLGRPGLALPTGRLVNGEAVWDAGALRWAGSYDGPRALDGANLGSRLPLPPGPYALTIETDGPPGPMPPALEVRPEGDVAGRSVQPLIVGVASLTATFDVRAGERAVKLAVRGGSPFRLKLIRLKALTAR